MLVGVKDFTPPFLGTSKIAQFTVSSRFGLGAWLIGGALALQLGAAWLSRRSALETSSMKRSPLKNDARFALATSHSIMKATRILFVSGVLLLVAVFVTGIYIVPKLQAGSPATARQSDASRVSLSDVFVDATYATPDFVKRVKLEPYLQHWQGRAQPFLIGINTHVGTIANLDLRGKVFVEDSQGDRFPSLGTPVVVSEHHNMYLLVFPLLDNSGQPIFAAKRGHFRLIVDGVGKTAERSFEWKLPVIESTPARTVASTLMLMLSVVGALMVILSPCAIELTTYYTGIIAGVVSSAALAERGTRLPLEVRGRILRNLTAFVAGFTILYMASGATVALMGQQLLGMQAKLEAGASLKELFCGIPPSALNESITAAPVTHAGHMSHGPGFGAWAHYANLLGAAFLVYFALKSVGVLETRGPVFRLAGAARTQVPHGDRRRCRVGLGQAGGYHSRAGIKSAPARQYHADQFLLCRPGIVRQLPDLHGRRDPLSVADFRGHLDLVLGRLDSGHVLVGAGHSHGGYRRGRGQLDAGNSSIVPG